MSGVKRLSVDDKWCTSIVQLTCDISTHGSKRSHDTLHRAGADRIVSVKFRSKFLSGKDS